MWSRRQRCLRSAAFAGAAVLVGSSVAHAAAFTDVTNLDGGGWRVVYQKHIGTSGSLQSAAYDTNNTSATFGGVAGTGTVAANSYTRVAYYLELSGSGNANDTNGNVFVSFDASSISTDPAKIGIPTTSSGEFYQKNVTNMHVIGSGAGGIVNQSNTQNGNIEFWPSNYTQTNSASVPNAQTSNANAANAAYDWGDGGASTGAGYGSMQIANHSLGTSPDTGQMLLNFNNWGGGSGNYDIGLGNFAAAVANNIGTDWTFDHNAANYTVRDLQILVNTPEPGSLALLALGAVGLLARKRRQVSL